MYDTRVWLSEYIYKFHARLLVQFLAAEGKKIRQVSLAREWNCDFPDVLGATKCEAAHREFVRRTYVHWLFNVDVADPGYGVLLRFI